MSTAFESIRIGRWDLPQRFVMAPLTRNRAGEGQAPTELNAEYYGQRASAGLIITEGTQPSAVGQGYLDTPGMHSDEQVAGWRLVADAVHAGGGHVVVQLMHAGRIAHPDNKGGLESVAPSAIAAPGKIVTPKRSAGVCRPARPRDRRDPRARGGVRPRCASGRRGRARRRRGARRERLPAAPVPRAVEQRAHRRLRRLAREPRPPDDRDHDGRGRGDRRRPRRHPHLAGAQHPGRPRGGRGPRPRRPTSRSSRASRRSGSPTSASSATRSPTSSATCASASAGRSSSTPAFVR